jgi:hypothetical protein
MKQPPCRDCPEKGCGEKHDTCKSYQEWKAEVNAVHHKMGAEAQTTGRIVESVLRIKRKAKKK